MGISLSEPTIHSLGNDMNAINTELKQRITNLPSNQRPAEAKRLRKDNNKSTAEPQAERIRVSRQNEREDLIYRHTNYEESLLREMLYFDRF